jgi:hypothetical protein
MSCRNAVLRAAASADVSGGVSLVFVRPGADAFAITATAQVPRLAVVLKSMLMNASK